MSMIMAPTFERIQRLIYRRGVVLALVGAMVVTACGGVDDSAADVDTGAQNNSETSVTTGSDTDDTDTTIDDAVASDDGDVVSESTAGEAFDWDSFVLCPVIEEHKGELAAILGFEIDPERAVETFTRECNIQALNGYDFARVELGFKAMPSVEFKARGYEDPASPEPALGNEAVYIDASDQPHLIFLVGGLIVDVGARVEEMASPRDTLIAYALRVRELLTEANG
ncbi:MAG: hypothetical protein ABFR95_00360 [Actinomycetota bacterium]